MPGRTRNIDAPASQDTSMQDEPPSAQPAPAEDSEMEDRFAPKIVAEEEDGEEEEVVEAQRIKILPGSTDTAATFEFTDEGHTLGNALRYIVMKNPDVEFCAYTIPHPSEPKMNFRIQTYGKTCYIGAKACLDVRLTPTFLDGAAVDALKKGLHDLQDVCDVVAEEFWAKRQAFNSEQGVEQ
ncbi:hypothetical protein E4U43_006410 [Claviceps pusilla]|uniref:DNA-directed RNA polymerase RBP11-like dimerisation domain-containing protein n=1 Tax=Claviceps pusilla TaxID=123648 RepID=A0A9P7T168_9HYPO|nr:hypothetical protein E4U43_006410 [Claviceps pusilla]